MCLELPAVKCKFLPAGNPETLKKVYKFDIFTEKHFEKDDN